MSIDRVRMMKKTKEWTRATRVYTIVNGTDSAEVWFNITPFTLVLSNMTVYIKYMNLSNPVTGAAVAFRLYTDNNYAVHVHNFMYGSTYAYVNMNGYTNNTQKYAYQYIIGGINNVTGLTYSWGGTKPTVDSYISDYRYAVGNSSAFNTWKNNIQNPITKIRFAIAKREEYNRSFWIYEYKVTNNNVVVFDMVPCKFKNGEYGLVDLISGQFVKKDSFSGASLTFYGE